MISTSSRLKSALRSLDGVIAELVLPVTSERDTLLSFLFHGLFRDEEELNHGSAHPQQGITVDLFRRFIAYFRGQGYTFVSPGDILAGLAPGGKYLLLTFDDGYYNNLRALPVLEEFQVPALFFISTEHVRKGKSFWWDGVYRDLRRRGRSAGEIEQAIAGYKRLSGGPVEARVISDLGPAALRPESDVDRPFTPSELKQFASHPLVFLGNHTRDHAILTRCSADEVRRQIEGGQQDLRELAGKDSAAIAYPNGDCSPAVIDAAMRAGLRLGFLARPGKNRLPVTAGTIPAMMTRRFMIWGDCDIETQCKVARCDLSLHRVWRAMKDRNAASALQGSAA